MSQANRFEDLGQMPETMDLSDSKPRAGPDVNVAPIKFNIGNSGTPALGNDQNQDFEEFVKRPFEGKLTLDEPVSQTIVSLAVIERNEIWTVYGKKQKLPL